ncbi:MAG: tRNA (adenosine(37)-N6)-threonylcarbamoyltransferase complex dimerization subunit type 1 TsaB [Actinobacteria bacterium]|uniref:N(6)-L-threonylcarbamoyladenine synthase n=1 Tax=freshwater metagenome TaxID=449393 RepID=A0A6J7CM80_9ZZZZ|nr:tRNA (adenosine(37)-N6)-threonylcarbamoyltransferase complex dimerization subunit type 1 TsaB [Actinomycetota bacterium]
MSLLTVGIDTSTFETGVGVVLPDGRALERFDIPQPGTRPAHSSATLRMLEQALSDVGAGFDEIGRVAVTVGPGSFTGIRIGLATANGLALAVGVKAQGASSLLTLLRGAAALQQPAVALIDARRGELFVATSTAPQDRFALPLTEQTEWWQGFPAGAICIGDGAIQNADVLTAAGFTVPVPSDSLHRISPIDVCLEASSWPEGVDVAPEYLRRPDAVPTSERGS